MSLYQALTPEMFRTKLTEGTYDGRTGANRALGKVRNWTEKQLKEARALIEEHFGEGLKKKRGSGTTKRATQATRAPNKIPKPAPVAPMAREPRIPVARSARPAVSAEDADVFHKILESIGAMNASIEALRGFAARDEKYRPVLDRLTEALLDAYRMLTELILDYRGHGSAQLPAATG